MVDADNLIDGLIEPCLGRRHVLRRCGRLHGRASHGGGWSRSEGHTIVTIFGWSLGGFKAKVKTHFPDDDSELAVEQAIQLDESTDWVQQQLLIAPNRAPNFP